MPNIGLCSLASGARPPPIPLEFGVETTPPRRRLVDPQQLIHVPRVRLAPAITVVPGSV